MDTLKLTSELISLFIFLVALYEAASLVRIIGRIPRFWIFFIGAIAVVIANRVLQILSPSIANTDVDTDVVPILFSGLLLMWIYDMKESFQRVTPKPNPELTASEQG